MEKYTVDLDKVLNDFEYNELALEQDSLNLLATTSSAVLPAYASTNRLKPTAGTTKHSINTVFKSLDDYINSDIPIVPTYKPREDNNNISRVVPAESNLLVDISSQDEEVVIRNPSFHLLESDNSITEGLNLEISSQEDMVFDKKTVLDDIDGDNSDSESTESIYLDMSGGSKNVVLAPNETPKIIKERKTESPKPVGFDNTLDIDDSELSQYLEDLEKELDVPKEDVNLKNNTFELQRKFAENEVKIVGDFKLEIKEDKAKDRRRDSMQGQPGSTPYNNAYISKEFNSPKTNDVSDENIILELQVQPDKDPSNEPEKTQAEANAEVEINPLTPPAGINQESAAATSKSANDGDNVSCDSSVSLSSSADTASSSAMSPTFSEASTNSVQSAESGDAKKQQQLKSVESPRFGLVVSADASVLRDDAERREEDGERLLSLDLDDSIDEHEQLEQEQMLLDDSSRSEEIGAPKPVDTEEEISVIDFIAETSVLQQQPTQTPKSIQQQQQLLSNNESTTSIENQSTDTKDIAANIQQETTISDTSSQPEDVVNSSAEQSSNQAINNNQIETFVNMSTSSTSLSDSIPVDSRISTAVTSLDEATAAANSWLGKEQPIWIPDTEALNCLHCDMKFTMIKRRHHCRACGLVLCSRCCNSKFRLEYLNNREDRVCTKCHEILLILYPSCTEPPASASATNSSEGAPRQPNPNNPMDYCSTVPPPLQQLTAGGGGAAAAGGSASGGTVPSVMVPVGVLKRNGSTAGSKKSSKSVMFCDGIRPGSDLTNLDQDFNYNMTTSSGSGRRSPGAGSNTSSEGTIGSASGDGSPQLHQLTSLAGGGHKILGRLSGGANQPDIDKGSKSFIPASVNGLPPKVTVYKSDISYSECSNSPSLMETLRNESVTFAIQKNLYVNVKIVNMSCCINKTAWCFSTEGMMSVGQDEILILLETMENEAAVPKDVFYHFNDIYLDAVKGQTVAELGVSLHNHANFLDSKSHVGFLYIRPTFQCLQNLIIPKESYLIGILIHRWETPWAKVFPLRLVLRLGAEYRYYPSPIISTRHRDSVFVEIGHTIINILADFRNFSYSLPHIRGLSILMEEKNTTITIPVNRYDQVMKTLNNSSEHILAFGGNFSSQADSHLVCIQNKNGTSENTYTTHAININHKPRKITGASYIVFNGALKSTSGLTAKSSIVEDGLMIQIHPEEMIKVRDSLRQMRDHVIRCGPVAAPPPTGGDAATAASGGETVMLKWGEADVCFNVGVKSLIDDASMSGIPSIRVHQGKDFVCNSGNRFIRWTEVFILQNGEENNKTSEPVDVSKVASDIARATCAALVKYLDLLASNNFYKVGIRTNLHIENVSYSAGSNGIKLPPIYMKSLDNELIPVLHRITASNSYASAVVLELVFRILNAGGDSAVPQHLVR